MAPTLRQPLLRRTKIRCKTCRKVHITGYTVDLLTFQRVSTFRLPPRKAARFNWCALHWIDLDCQCIGLDVQMAGLSGLDVLARLSVGKTAVPAGIVMTAYESRETHESALGAGAVAILSKPFDCSVFVKALELALR